MPAGHGEFIDSNPTEEGRDLRCQHTSGMKADLMRVKRDSRSGRVEQAERRRAIGDSKTEPDYTVR